MLIHDDGVTQRRLRRNIALVSVIRVIVVASIWLPMPVVVLYVTGKGLGSGEFLLLQVAFQLTAFLLEIPFGCLADRYGRKRFLVLGAALLAAGAYQYSCSHDLWSFLLGEVVYALGQASFFGAEQALLRRSLERLGRAKEFQRIWGNALSLELLVAACTTAAGGFLFAQDPRLPFLCESVLYSIAFLLSCLLFEAQLIPEGNAQRNLLREALAVTHLCLIRSSVLRWIMLSTSLWSALLVMIIWSQSDLLLEHGVRKENLGVCFCLLSLVGSVVGLFTARFGIVRSKRKATVVVLSVFVLGLSLCALVPQGPYLSYWVFLGLGILQLPRSSWRIIGAGWIQEELDSKSHATASSITAAMSRLGYIVFAMCLYPFIDGWSLREKLLVFALFAGVAGLLLHFWAPKSAALRG